MERKLIKHGPSSKIIALPAQWVRDQQLSAGDTVAVLPDGDRLIITANRPAEQREITLNLDGLDSTGIVLLIRCAYRIGYSKLAIQYTKNTVHHYEVDADVTVAAAVNEELNRLIGFEITHEEEGALVIQEITRPAAQELLNLFRKAFTMTHQLILQIAESNHKEIDVRARHDVITKIVSYAIRIITIGEANLPSAERTRMMHSLRMLDLIVGLLKYNHRDNTAYTESFLHDLELAFTEMERIVFARERKALVAFQEVKHRLDEEPFNLLLPITEVLFEIVLLYATD